MNPIHDDSAIETVDPTSPTLKMSRLAELSAVDSFIWGECETLRLRAMQYDDKVYGFFKLKPDFEQRMFARVMQASSLTQEDQADCIVKIVKKIGEALDKILATETPKVKS